jgi:hypothetical protein
MVKNRDRWTVQTVHPVGGLTVFGPTGQVRLPAGYVADHVTLAYAETSHANQGRTVDRSILYLDGPTGTAGIYVPLTRGRHRNDAYVVVHGEQTAADVVAESLARTWIDRPAIAVRAEHQAATPSRAAPLLSGDELRRLIERHAELDHTLTMAGVEADISQRRLVNLSARRAATVNEIDDYQRRLAAAQQVVADHDRLLVRRRHRLELAGAHSQLEWIPAAIERAKTKLAEIDNDTADTMAKLIEASTINQRQPELRVEQAAIGRQLHQDRHQRADRLATKTPTVVIDVLGPRPHDGAGEALWEEAAGRLAQHHAAYGQPGGDLLGRKPRLMGDEAYAASYWPTAKAIEHLDHALGRAPEMEPPHHSLGRSL